MYKWTNCFGKQKITDTSFPGVYEGQYLNGEPNGQGTYTYTYGGKYVGEFKDGKKHGQGTWVVEDGTVYKGIWENDKLVVVNEIN